MVLPGHAEQHASSHVRHTDWMPHAWITCLCSQAAATETACRQAGTHALLDKATSACKASNCNELRPGTLGELDVLGCGPAPWRSCCSAGVHVKGQPTVSGQVAK